MESNGDGQVWAIIKSEFVILGDVQILFPPNDFTYTRGTKVYCLHASVLLRSLTNDTICAADGGSLLSVPNSDGEVLRW